MGNSLPNVVLKPPGPSPGTMPNSLTMNGPSVGGVPGNGLPMAAAAAVASQAATSKKPPKRKRQPRVVNGAQNVAQPPVPVQV